jgi:lysophospholipase L1-like esterase
MQADCPTSLFGEYTNEILEGRLATKQDKDRRGVLYCDSLCEDSATTEQPNKMKEKTDVSGVGTLSDTEFPKLPVLQKTPDHIVPKNVAKRKVHLILGDSNTVRLHVKDPDVMNISLSGKTLNDIKILMNKVNLKTDETINSVIIHLGTNDIGNADNEAIVKSAVNAMKLVSETYPNIPIGFSSILPRMGTSKFARSFNDSVKAVNSQVLDFCSKEKGFHFVDNDLFVFKNGKFQKNMFDSRDPHGLHVSEEGADELYCSLTAFLIEGESDELGDQTPWISRKRTRGDSSSTPPSADRKTKAAKNQV